MRSALLILVFVAGALAAGRLPPVPPPPSNPSSPLKAELGRYLFYDTRLSFNNLVSCATCHRQELAFTDGRAHSSGASGQPTAHSAMSLVNLAWSKTFNWSDTALHSLEEQALKPMLSVAPVELGYGAIEQAFLVSARRDSLYSRLFRAAFPADPNPFNTGNIAAAVATFERSITSANSPWDRFHFDEDQAAISEAAKRGEVLFFLDGGPECFRCHTGVNFTDGQLHNTALYDPYPEPEPSGRFRTPTLRNIALTAPYMHDGSIATLEDVVDHYAAGGRAPGNPAKDPLLHGFRLTPRNRSELVAFLQSLTDSDLIRDPRYGDPWPRR